MVDSFIYREHQQVIQREAAFDIITGGIDGYDNAMFNARKIRQANIKLRSCEVAAKMSGKVVSVVGSITVEYQK